MSVLNVLKTTTAANSPLDGSGGSAGKAGVSDFLTIQSLTNFGAMTGAITAGWHALQTLTPAAKAIWVPYAFAFAWGVISILISLDGLRREENGVKTLKIGDALGAVFVAGINALVLAGAVVGTSVATTAQP